MMKETAGIAVLFPGIGYTCDKPLLYYSEKIARERGYEIRRVPYGNFPPGVKGDAAKMVLLQWVCVEEVKDTEPAPAADAATNEAK